MASPIPRSASAGTPRRRGEGSSPMSCSRRAIPTPRVPGASFTFLDRAPAMAAAPLETPLVYPAASSFLLVPDSLKHAAGTPLNSMVKRLAYAWSMQDFRLLFNDLPQPQPTITAHPHVRELGG